MKPKVLIEVHRGMTDYRTAGDVDVLLVNWDAIRSGDEIIPDKLKLKEFETAVRNEPLRPDKD